MKTAQKPSVDRQTIEIFARAAWRNKKDFLWALAYPLGVIFTAILVPFTISHILADLTRSSFNTTYVWLLVAAALVGLIANRYGFKQLMNYAAKTQTQLQTAVLQVLLKQSAGFHNDHISGKLVSDAIDYPLAFATLDSVIIIELLPFLLTTLVGLGIVTARSWLLGSSLSLIVIIVIGWAWFDNRNRTSIRSKRLAANQAVTAHLADTLVNAQTVKTFAREKHEIATHKKLNIRLQDIRIHDWGRDAIRGNNRMATVTILQILFVLVIIHVIRRNPSFLAVGIYAFTYTVSLTTKLFDLGVMFRKIEDALFQASAMTEIFTQPVDIIDKPAAPSIQLQKGAITFERVDFRYNDAKESVFNNLTLHIAAGEKVGLVGPSGGGKSTFTRLLLRFEDVTAGSIQIDGQDLRDVTQDSLHEVIGYVPQEPLLFQRSVYENIAYGQPAATTEAINNVARQANADGFIASLPHGYDTLVGERGVKLSGGQRQRIAIARALLKDAPILVLDEATSALDSESEAMIQEALWNLMKDRTAIVIAHRLSTIQRMDRIIVINDGNVVEQGSHSDLLKQKGLYAKLWAHQSGGFIEE